MTWDNNIELGGVGDGGVAGRGGGFFPCAVRVVGVATPVGRREFAHSNADAHKDAYSGTAGAKVGWVGGEGIREESPPAEGFSKFAHGDGFTCDCLGFNNQKYMEVRSLLGEEKLLEPGGTIDVDEAYSESNHGEVVRVDCVGVVGDRVGLVGRGGVG